jgi:hypothetical protein
MRKLLLTVVIVAIAGLSCGCGSSYNDTPVYYADPAPVAPVEGGGGAM